MGEFDGKNHHALSDDRWKPGVGKKTTPPANNVERKGILHLVEETRNHVVTIKKSPSAKKRQERV